MQLTLREHVPDRPEVILWKADPMFTGLGFTDAFARVAFVEKQTWASLRTPDRLGAFGAGAEQLEVALNELIPKRIVAVMRAAALDPERGQVYITGGSVAAADIEIINTETGATSGAGELIP